MHELASWGCQRNFGAASGSANQVLAAIRFTCVALAACRGGSPEQKEIKGPWDHIFHKTPKNSSYIEKALPNDENEDWATDADLLMKDPAGAAPDARPKALWINPELKFLASESTTQDWVVVNGRRYDATLYDIVLTASRGQDGSLQEIIGKHAQIIVKCVKDSTDFIPCEEEKNVFRFMLEKCRLSNEARGIVEKHLAMEPLHAPEPPRLRHTEELAPPDLKKPRQAMAPMHPTTALDSPPPPSSNQDPGSSNQVAGEPAASAPRQRRKPSSKRQALPDLYAELKAHVDGGDTAAAATALERVRRAAGATDAPPPPTGLVALVKRLRSSPDAAVAAAAAAVARRWKKPAAPPAQPPR